MKKAIVLILIFLLALCGCENDTSAPEKTSSDQGEYAALDGDYPSYFEYKYTSESQARFAVSDDGRVVVSLFNNGTSNLIEYSMDGSSRKIGECAGFPESIAFMGNELYIYKVNRNSDGAANSIKLIKINTDGGKNETCAEFDIPIECGYGMSGNENELYIIGADPNRPDITCNYENSIDYGYSVFIYSDGACEKIPVDFPSAVCAKKGGGAIIAACDDDGYYITQYKDGKLLEKKYTNNIMVGLNGIADIDGEHLMYACSTSPNNTVLCASDIKNMYNSELIPGTTVNGEQIYATGGYCYYQILNKNDSGEYTICRVKFSEYYKYNDPITLICSEYSGDTPFGCGYTIEVKNPTNEETALKILSQDKDYDMCYISTFDNISYAIKNKGSFYPLNEVAGASEYLDKCFPTIKEAFTDENGDIWALPIYANSDFIYKNCGDADYSKMKLCEFVDYIDGFSDEDMAKAMFFSSLYTKNVLRDYASKNNSFDTAEFRIAAEKLKNSKNMNCVTQDFSGQGNLMLDEHTIIYFSADEYVLDILRLRDYEVSGTPCISDANVIVPSVVFMCVNPNSAHLQDTLDYISKIAEYQLTQPDNFVLTGDNGVYSDSETVRQMIELSSTAEITFTYPDELYQDDFRKYLADEISLDDFIVEADRKLKAYLNE